MACDKDICIISDTIAHACLTCMFTSVDAINLDSRRCSTTIPTRYSGAGNKEITKSSSEPDYFIVFMLQTKVTVNIPKVV